MNYLNDKKFPMTLSCGREKLITSIVSNKIQDGIVVDRSCYKAMNVFGSKQHRRKRGGLGGKSPILSLFGQLDHTCTAAGQRQLRDFLFYPIGDYCELADRYRVVGRVKEWGSREVAEFQKLIKGIKNIQSMAE